ncbi:hypothetical protein EVAR_16012_1 [Eumeta japonica]|uniref:Uncharacterized protein n=1 Tax=Eumeta variegata TaxID=151549 RepID=A0A4C1VW86_EUMVA|nr:hypothetical protein EVAR_16012_1 [Eumeta japonica]
MPIPFIFPISIPPKSSRSPPPMDTYNPKGVNSALPASWIGIGRLIEENILANLTAFFIGVEIADGPENTQQRRKTYTISSSARGGRGINQVLAEIKLGLEYNASIMSRPYINHDTHTRIHTHTHTHTHVHTYSGQYHTCASFYNKHTQIFQ